MLGKLYITVNSSAENLRRTTELVIEAIDGNIATDAASRNALNKLHLALSKAIRDGGDSGRNADEMPASVDQDGLTVVEDRAEDSILATKDVLKTESVADRSIADMNYSLMDELLSDEEC